MTVLYPQQQNQGGGAGSSRIEITATSIEEGDLEGKSVSPLTLYNPVDLTEELLRLGKSVDGFSGIVNTLNYVPRGRTSSTGWFLTTRKDIEDNLPLLSEGKLQGVSIRFKEVAEQLQFKTQTRYGHEHDFTVENLIAVHAYAVTGIPEPPVKVSAPNINGLLNSQGTSWENQFYVVQVVDWRYFNHLSSVDSATGAGSAKDESLNTRSKLWDETSTTDKYAYTPATTWSAALTSLWDTLPDKGTLGTGNANFPSGQGSYPWNRKYWGVSTWDALNDLIDGINHVLVRDLDGNYELEDLADHVDTTTKDERSTKESELISITNDMTGPSLPEKIRVVFPKLDYNFQTSSDSDEVTPQDYWHNRPVWYKDINATTIDADAKIISGTIQIIHSGMYAQWEQRAHTAPDVYPNTTATAPANVSDLNTKATDLATQYVKSRNDEDDNSPHILEELYRGFIDFTPTKSLSSIVWAELGTGPLTRIKNLPNSREGEMVRQPSMSRSGGGGSGAPSARYEVSASSSQRVANEFPGSPDHARLGEPALRWAVVSIPENVAPSSSTTADVLYGTISGSNLVLGNSNKDITVHNVSTTTIIQADAIGLALWHEQMRRWVFVPWADGGSHWPPLDLYAREFCPSRAGTGVNGLLNYSSTVACISPVHTISVDKSVFLRGVRNTTTPSCGYAEDFLITIDHAPVTVGQGAVFWSDGSKIRWTRSPSIAKHLFIGDGESPSDPPFLEFQHGASFAPTNYWALICQPLDTGFLSSTDGGRPIGEQAGINQKWIAPNDVSPYNPGRHLSIKTTGGEGGDNKCIKLRWTAQGVFGTFDFKGIGDELYTVDFDDGIVVGIYGSGGAGITLVPPREDDLEDADCSYVADVDVDPCA
tara:strand:+ start:8651 stop:11284 length:2634 start_codon:yes stop_codon:yes gene_type:complete